MFDEYKHLSESMPPDALRKYIERLMDTLEGPENFDIEKAAEALSELADKQWHTYELIDPVLGERIDRWIRKVWKPKSTYFVNNILSIVGNLGLDKSNKYIIDSLQPELDPKIRLDIERFANIFERRGGDPYYEMKRGIGYQPPERDL